MIESYKIADHVFSVESIYPDVHKYCRDYRTDEPSEFTLRVTPEDIEYERALSTKDRVFPDGYLEELAVYRKIAELAPSFNTFLFHGSCVAVDGKGYLFTAKSGIGKSTHTKLWCDLFPDRAVMVNDDKPLIRVDKDGVFIYGTPYNGKHRRGSNICVPLTAICLLSRGKENHIERITEKAAYPVLFAQTYRSKDPIVLQKTLTLLDGMLSHVRLYDLKCNMKIEAAKTAYEGINEPDATLDQ